MFLSVLSSCPFEGDRGQGGMAGDRVFLVIAPPCIGRLAVDHAITKLAMTLVIRGEGDEGGLLKRVRHVSWITLLAIQLL